MTDMSHTANDELMEWALELADEMDGLFEDPTYKQTARDLIEANDLEMLRELVKHMRTRIFNAQEDEEFRPWQNKYPY